MKRTSRFLSIPHRDVRALGNAYGTDRHDCPEQGTQLIIYLTLMMGTNATKLVVQAVPTNVGAGVEIWLNEVRTRECALGDKDIVE